MKILERGITISQSLLTLNEEQGTKANNIIETKN